MQNIGLLQMVLCFRYVPFLPQGNRQAAVLCRKVRYFRALVTWVDVDRTLIILNRRIPIAVALEFRRTEVLLARPCFVQSILLYDAGIQVNG